MNGEQKSIQASTLPFDFKQFLFLFQQLSTEHKKLVVNTLKKELTQKKASAQPTAALKGSVLKYELPFEPAGEWEVLQ
jgi:hypothetical protein